MQPPRIQMTYLECRRDATVSTGPEDSGARKKPGVLQDGTGHGAAGGNGKDGS